MAYQFRNPVYSSEDGRQIDIEINHPSLGWIAFTARADDPESIGRDLFQLAIQGEVAPYLPSAPTTLLYPVDLWSRMTNEEADQVEVAMIAQPSRIQNIFRSASSYRSDHELWPLLEDISITLFGEERTREILAPSD